MIYTIVIALIILLIILAIVVGAVQQHKQRLELERRKKMARLRSSLEQIEDLIHMSSFFPIGKSMLAVLNSRAYEVLKNMNSVSPSKDYQARIQDYEERIQSVDRNDTSLISEDFEIPQNNKQIIAMINGLKRLRATLRSEHSRGRVDSNVFSVEDQRLTKLQLKISIETLIRRGRHAYESQMLGSARQYYEKALRTIEDQNFSDDYTTSRQQSIKQALEQIAQELKDAHARDKERHKKEDDLEELFQPKKKW
ncbi:MULTISPECIES: hypothetical protein [Idiomarina]|jgi:uncharacterized phage infection (PIP) family protein YhgE|uniref:hypothetical protein n=1 Tax=Idiomarina TaxID=135575 RepID=UPI0006C8DB1F|nr:MULTISPECIES: hypothetical protein [Idiomarina]KPD22950.1 membrane protein [Idiomarina abyssalis]MDA6065689.1 hypothetical protein [Idiomarina abyssalis]SFT50646.1 hypothetical protein SAMN04515657_0918 [Idiomarina abyssalis]|tara:strand:- start:11406 stop:12164 length:759 start_codon:yes stop_codon:yes gene_type:complete